MAQAGVSYTWGREGDQLQYNESLAGVRDRTPLHQFRAAVSPMDARGRLLPEIMPRSKDPVGAADKRVQAYNFRLCMTKNADNRVAWPKPPDYSAARYELLARYLPAFEKDAWPSAGDQRRHEGGHPSERQNRHQQQRRVFNGLHRRQLRLSRRQLRDSRADTSGARRLHSGLLLFPGHRPRVPASLSAEMKEWGLCRDEFTDTDHWPYQLYVREARRMVGEYVMSQKDIQTELTKPDSIGMGSYNSDSHNVQRRPTEDGAAVENEGDMQVPVTPYQIPYRLMLPKRARGHQPPRAGVLLGDARGLLDAAHGAAVHDYRPGGRASRRRWRSTGSRPCRTSIRGRCRRSCFRSARCVALTPAHLRVDSPGFREILCFRLKPENHTEPLPARGVFFAPALSVRISGDPHTARAGTPPMASAARTTRHITRSG